jgi:hypothetical protein
MSILVMVHPEYMDLFKYHHGPRVKPQSLTSRGKLKNRAVNVVAALPLSNKDGTAISRTGNNSLSNK